MALLLDAAEETHDLAHFRPARPDVLGTPAATVAWTGVVVCVVVVDVVVGGEVGDLIPDPQRLVDAFEFDAQRLRCQRVRVEGGRGTWHSR